jgi:hypothetical protein
MNKNYFFKAIFSNPLAAMCRLLEIAAEDERSSDCWKKDSGLEPG